MFQCSNYLSSMEALTAAQANFFTAFIELRDLTEDLEGAPSGPPAQVHHEPPPRAPDTALVLPARAAAVSAGTGPVSPKHLPRGAPPPPSDAAPPAPPLPAQILPEP